MIARIINYALRLQATVRWVIMAWKCDICGKGSVSGNNVPRKGQPRKKGGAGQHIGVKTKRVFKPNLVNMKTIIDGTPITVKICTRCLRTGYLDKAV